MFERGSRIGGAVRAAALIFCAVLVAALCRDRFKESVGVDFYQYWSISKALQFSGGTLGSPYVEAGGLRYVEVLRRFESGADLRLRRIAAFRNNSFEVIATPFAYTVYAPIPPDDYTRSLALFTAFEALSFFAAVVSLTRLFGRSWFESLLLGLLLLAAYDPVASDLRVANMGGIQLLLLTGALRLSRSAEGSERAAAALSSLLAVATILKPSVVLIAAGLALSTALRLTMRARVRTVACGVAAGAAAIGVSTAFFRTTTVWLDWYRYVYGADHERLAYDARQGNVAMAMRLAPVLHVTPSRASLYLLGVLGASLLAVLAARSEGLRASVRRAIAALREPELAAAMATLVTLAASALVWLHYEILLVLPVLWLIFAVPEWRVRVLGLASLLLASGRAAKLVVPMERYDLVALVHSVSWVPAWCAILLVLYHAAGSAPSHGAQVPGSK